MGVPSRGLAYAQKAKHIGELVGDMHTMTMSMLAEAWSQQGLGNLLCAEKLCREAREQLPLIAKDTEDHLPEILLTKTEYQEARALLFKTLEYRSSCKPPISDTVVCHINLALIAIEIGAGVEVIKHHIDAVRTQCTTFVVWATGILWADTLTAPVHLLEGNISLARETFQKCLLSSQNTKVAEISAFCLSKLADLQHAMYGHWDTMRWAVVYLAFGMTTTNKVSITRALRCIGDLLVVEGDHETSLNVFSTALDAFTFMDIHRDRADCMVCTAEIFEIRGEIEKSVDLWRKARPLYEKSSQAQEILKIDEKLAILAHEMKQQHWRG
jgi:tetratricopeptide (TPR) repeat protein